MAEVLVGPDVEQAVIDELAVALPLAHFTDVVSTRIPRPRPDQFVRVLGTGGSGRDLVSVSPSVTVECFDVDEVVAGRLARYALGALEACARAGDLGGVTCYRVESFALPANLPMESVPDRARYTFTVSVDVRKSTS